MRIRRRLVIKSAVLAVLLLADCVVAQQPFPNINEAEGRQYSALTLHKAPSDFRGHKAEAIRLIRGAIAGFEITTAGSLLVNLQRENFFVGGNYKGSDEARVMHGQMHVEMLTPEDVRHPWPLMFIHGAAQTGTGWITTPDGRQGWAPGLPNAAGRSVSSISRRAAGRPGSQAWMAP